MLFTLKHLGRLQEATIDLGKDLIVLTGLNNTSKTYVAHAIYGYCHEIEALGGALWLKADPGSTEDADKRVSIDLLAIVDQHLDDIGKSMAASYVSVLRDVLAAPQSFTSSTQIETRLDEDEIAAGKARILADQVSVEESLLDERILIDKPSRSGTWTATRVAGATGTRSSEERASQVLRFFRQIYVTRAFVHAFFGALTRPHILTAERSAVEVFSRELAVQRIDAKRQDGSPPAYPLALTEGLKSTYQMASARGETSPYAAEADRLERDILEGAIDLGAHGEMLFLPAGTTERLDMNLSSSSVKALAGLSFYLRHRARRGDFLIIDEPELNLHPHNQRKVARLLARLSRSGLKVMVSTHSDYIVRELNNLIMLSRDKDGALLKKHGYGDDETLSPERVGAYAFDGVHGRPIEIGPAGVKVEAIDRDIKELNRSSSDIYFTLADEGEA